MSNVHVVSHIDNDCRHTKVNGTLLIYTESTGLHHMVHDAHNGNNNRDSV